MNHQESKQPIEIKKEKKERPMIMKVEDHQESYSSDKWISGISNSCTYRLVTEKNRKEKRNKRNEQQEGDRQTEEMPQLAGGGCETNWTKIFELDL